MHPEAANNTPESTGSKRSVLNLFSTTVFYISILFFIIGFNFSDTMVGNWYQQFLPNLNGRPISDITFLDSLNGYGITGDGTVGDTNYILKTTNGGDNWNIIYSVYRDLTDVMFINLNTGFVCGGFNVIGGYLAKTTNAGLNWQQVTQASFGLHFEDMHVLNEDTLWLADDNDISGGIYRTTNGGLNWINQYFNSGGNPPHIYMYNARLGFNDGGNMQRTTNGGANWTSISGEGLFFDVHFTDSLTGWKCAGNMKKTTNGGINWIQQTLPSGGNFVFTDMLKFSNVNKDTIYGVGGVIATTLGGRGVIYRTTNGGDTWRFQIPDTMYNIFQYFHIEFVNKNMGWAYAPQKGVHTTNGGDPVWLTGIKQISSEIPTQYKLYQNYPNPFNPKTNIVYKLKTKGFVRLKIFDIRGKELIDLVNREQTAGTYQVDFSGSGYSSGVYFYSLIVEGRVIDTKKMVLVK